MSVRGRRRGPIKVPTALRNSSDENLPLFSLNSQMFLRQD